MSYVANIGFWRLKIKKTAGRVGGMKKLINFVENINSYKKTNNQ